MDGGEEGGVQVGEVAAFWPRASVVCTVSACLVDGWLARMRSTYLEMSDSRSEQSLDRCDRR